MPLPLSVTIKLLPSLFPRSPKIKMENLSLGFQTRSPSMESFALIPSKFPIPIGTLTRRRLGPHRTVSCELRTPKSVLEKRDKQNFGSISSATVNSTPPTPVACPQPYIGSPILWIGVGVGLSALFSVVATKLKRQAILHAFRTVMGQDAPQSGQFNTAAFSPGSPFPSPAAASSAPITSFEAPVAPQTAVKEDDSASNVEAHAATDANDKAELAKEASSHE